MLIFFNKTFQQKDFYQNLNIFKAIHITKKGELNLFSFLL